MSLTILPQDQIDLIVEVSDYILKHATVTVGAIRKKFGILSSRVEDIVKELPEGEVKDKLITALIESSIGENNALAKEDSKEI